MSGSWTPHGFWLDLEQRHYPLSSGIGLVYLIGSRFSAWQDLGQEWELTPEKAPRACCAAHLNRGSFQRNIFGGCLVDGIARQDQCET